MTAPWIINNGRLPDGRPAKKDIFADWQREITCVIRPNNTALVKAAYLAGLTNEEPASDAGYWWLKHWQELYPNLTWEQVAQDLLEFVKNQQAQLPEKITLYRGLAVNQRKYQYTPKYEIESWTSDKKVALAYAQSARDSRWGKYAKVIEKEFPREKILCWEVPGLFKNHKEVIVITK